ncbi:aspartyl-phosphate phosphatase Spo0E family protein [Natranaerobius trueperi]|uniref:Sporulation protein Spo0E n=1 Tax=Natranaerobius trueperi TaxID=759412 RepID=A0A226BZL4_9FIRM|nr:aspartyl-phosphate phosphatase Spo0E family protein [Natranaerobius trueperi]OWZ83537.1 sporulation protein Spo0E [Natranaerobius trueperi]
MDRNTLLQYIEDLRKELEELVYEKGDFNHSEVIKKSKELDQYLVYYDREKDVRRKNDDSSNIS